MKIKIALSIWAIFMLMSITLTSMLDITYVGAFFWGFIWGAAGIFIGSVVGDLYEERRFK